MMIDNELAMKIIGASFVFFAFIELIRGHYSKPGFWTLEEFGTSFGSFLNFLVVRAGLLFVISWMLLTLFPNGAGFMTDLPFIPVFLAYVLFEEYAHYWVHRWAHEWSWLWRFHKPHHTPKQLNLTVAFRENWAWFIFVPNAWLGAILVWGGQAEAAMLGAAIKGSSEWMVHSAVRWDLALQKNRLTRPIMWILERIITLPDTHHVHHGIGRYGNAMSNYGSFLFMYDLMHGTGTIPHKVQDGFGLPEGVKMEPWYEQLWWPFLRKPGAADLHIAPVDQTPLFSADDLDEASAVITTADGRQIVVG
jgi:sterol desaturase/sphingolipid hydroxylase (fatty acid hydroxylase superfamily)